MGIIKTVSVLWKTFKRYRYHVLVLVVLGLLGAVLEGIGINAVIPLISFFLGESVATPDFITSAIKSLFEFFSIPFTFKYLLGFILVLFIGRAVASVSFGYIRGWVSADYLCDESEDMLRRTMLSSWSFLLKQKLGTLQNTLVRDIQRTSNLLEIQGQIIQSFTGFLMYLLVAINISSTITIYTLIGGAVLLFVVRPFLARTQKFGSDLVVSEKKFAQFLSEHIIGMKSVKASGVERLAIRAGNEILRVLRSISLRLALARSMSASLFQPLTLIFIIIIFAISYSSPGFNIIAFAAALYLIQKMFTYLESGYNSFHSLGETLPYAENLTAYKKMLGDEREEKIIGTKPFIFKKKIDFENVSLSYKDRLAALSDINFSIKSGETVGLIGPSGSGKTSLADVVLRLFRPTEGKILIDGVPIEDISIDEWRKNIGYVSQDVFLLNDTIEENIRFYNKSLTKQDIEEAAKQANIYDFILSLPEGFKSEAGDRGVFFSGGQRQRIALARALAGRPSLLVLDEATSALDHESEKLIQESINSLHKKVTVLIIAHRPSTISKADRIIVLDGGKIVEEGEPQTLLKNPNSYFSKMQKHH